MLRSGSCHFFVVPGPRLGEDQGDCTEEKWKSDQGLGQAPCWEWNGRWKLQIYIVYTPSRGII